jgi:hypothetical protein
MRFEPTTIGALLKLVPRSQLAAVVKAHRGDHGVRQLSTWGQLVALLVAQLGGYGSLRELEAVLGSQGGAHYHLGIGRVCRSTLAVANARRPAALFEEMFRLVLGRLGGRVPPAVGREAIRLVDSTTIRLPEMLYGWARRTATHAAVKLHLVGACPPAGYAGPGGPDRGVAGLFHANTLPDQRYRRGGETAARAWGHLCDGSRLLRFCLLG